MLVEETPWKTGKIFQTRPREFEGQSTMIQITRLIGKESNNIVLKYIRVNFILPVF